MSEKLYELECYLKNNISRRKFLKVLFTGALFLISQNILLKLAFAKKGESNGRVKRDIRGKHDLVVASGEDPFKNTVEAIEAMGGMGLFVKQGSTVLVKPNMAWDRSPEQAANTNPAVVAAIVELCYTAGARRVNVFDAPCNDDRRVYENSGIKKAAEEKNAKVYFVDHWNVLKARFPYKSKMEGWPIFRDAIVCDTLINVPVLKHHGLTGLTLSMKNLMGVCSGTRGLMHVGLPGKLVDLTRFMNPELTVIDATRVLVRNGPSGGNLKDVEDIKKIIVSTDPTLADSYAATIMNKEPNDIPYIKEAIRLNYGNADITKARVHKITV